MHVVIYVYVDSVVKWLKNIVKVENFIYSMHGRSSKDSRLFLGTCDAV
jgi:hypothetical protein